MAWRSSARPISEIIFLAASSLRTRDSRGIFARSSLKFRAISIFSPFSKFQDAGHRDHRPSGQIPHTSDRCRPCPRQSIKWHNGEDQKQRALDTAFLNAVSEVLSCSDDEKSE